MTSLGQVVFAVENYRRFIFEQVLKARTDSEFGEQVLKKWQEAKAKIEVGITPTGLRLPRLALPDLDEAGEIVRFVCAEGLPGEFPYLTAAYSEQYLEPAGTGSTGNGGHGKNGAAESEEPTRLFAGLGLP